MLNVITSYDSDKMNTQILDLPESKLFSEKYGDPYIKTTFSTVKLKAYDWSSNVTINKDETESGLAERTIQLRYSLISFVNVPYYVEYTCSVYDKETDRLTQMFLVTSNILEHMQNHNCFKDKYP